MPRLNRSEICGSDEVQVFHLFNHSSGSNARMAKHNPAVHRARDLFAVVGQEWLKAATVPEMEGPHGDSTSLLAIWVRQARRISVSTTYPLNCFCHHRRSSTEPSLPIRYPLIQPVLKSF